jgi:hypothetical protein
LVNILADGVQNPYTTRAMGLVPVNAPKVTSVVGRDRELDDEFVETRLSFSRPDRMRESPDDRDSKGHRGANSTGNRGKGDEIKDGDKGHQR